VNLIGSSQLLGTIQIFIFHTSERQTSTLPVQCSAVVAAGMEAHQKAAAAAAATAAQSQAVYNPCVQMKPDHVMLSKAAGDGAGQAALQATDQRILQCLQQPQQLVTCTSGTLQQYFTCQPMLGNGQFAMPAPVFWNAFSHLGTVPVCLRHKVAPQQWPTALQTSLKRLLFMPCQHRMTDNEACRSLQLCLQCNWAHLWVESNWRCLLQASEPADADSLPVMAYSSCLRMANSSTNCVSTDISNSVQHTSDPCSRHLLQAISHSELLYCILPRTLMTTATFDDVPGLLRVTVVQSGSSRPPPQSGEVWGWR